MVNSSVSTVRLLTEVLIMMSRPYFLSHFLPQCIAFFYLDPQNLEITFGYGPGLRRLSVNDLPNPQPS